MPKFYQLWIILFFGFFAQAELRSAAALKTKFEKNIFSATLAGDYHFNEQAPNGIKIGEQLLRPQKIAKQDLVIADLPADVSQAVAYLYVCDDRNTFCEVHEIKLDANSISKKAKSLPQTLKIKLNSHGFYEGDFQWALDHARKENKLLLIDFGARWCPSCLRLENEIFASETFKKTTKKWLKFKVDVDAFTNLVLLDKYSVKGYPTVLFLNSAGDEMIRFVDFQPLDYVVGMIQEVAANPISLAELEKNQGDTVSQLKLGQRLFYSGQNSKAFEILKNQKVKPKEFLFAKVAAAQENFKKDSTQKENYLNILKSALSEEPESARSIGFRKSLIGLLPEKSPEVKILTEQSEALAKKLIQNPELMKIATATDFVGEYTGLENFYVAFSNAEVASAAKQNEITAWKMAADQAHALHISAKQSGAALRYLTCLMESQQFEQAYTLVETLLKQKPKDGDLQRRKMRILVAQKKYPAAVTIGEQALKNSYGINEFFVLEPLAKAYLGSNKKQKAQDLIAKYLSRSEIDYKEMKNIKAKLEELKKTF